jgi:hypothetical protein
MKKIFQKKNLNSTKEDNSLTFQLLNEQEKKYEATCLNQENFH